MFVFKRLPLLFPDVDSVVSVLASEGRFFILFGTVDEKTKLFVRSTPFLRGCISVVVCRDTSISALVRFVFVSFCFLLFLYLRLSSSGSARDPLRPAAECPPVRTWEYPGLEW